MQLRLACRTLRRSPCFTATAVGTIALTITLGATVFAIVDGVLFKPLPYPAADRLFTLHGLDAAGAGETLFSAPDIEYLNEADPRIAVTSTGLSRSLVHPDRPDVSLRVLDVDQRFFDVLGQHPVVGAFADEHFRDATARGAPRPAIVSYAFWRQALGGDPEPLGRRVDMLAGSLLVVGVLPRDFVFPVDGGFEILAPLAPSPGAAGDRWRRQLTALARFGGDVDPGEAKARLDAVLGTHAPEYAPRESGVGPYVAIDATLLSSSLGQESRHRFSAAFAGATLLILLGALNVAALVAARTRDRQRELSIRAALGANRRDILDVVLSETTVISLAGAVTGVLLARPVLQAALGILPEFLPRLKEPVIDWRVVWFALVAAVVPLTLIALVPAAAAIRRKVPQGLAGSGIADRTRSGGRAGILLAQHAVAIMAVLSGALLLTSFIVVRTQDVGFEADRLAIVDLLPRGSQAEWRARTARALERMRRVPGVTAAATVSPVLLEGGFMGTRFTRPAGVRIVPVADAAVSAGFFDVAGLEVRDGRVPSDAEIDAGRPFAVVSESVARSWWPNQRAVGQTLESDRVTAIVIGVVEEVRLSSQWNSHGTIFLPESVRDGTPRKSFLIRTTGNPDAVAADVAGALRRDLPDVVVRWAMSFDAAAATLARSMRLMRFGAVLFGVTGAAALFLVGVGVVGLVATSVARRLHEIGVRTALGARPAQLIGPIVLQTMVPSLAGTALGLLGSWWAVRLLRGFLFAGVGMHDSLAWAAATGTLVLVGAIAAWIPASRASRVDPVVVLRAE